MGIGLPSLASSPPARSRPTAATRAGRSMAGRHCCSSSSCIYPGVDGVRVYTGDSKKQAVDSGDALLSVSERDGYTGDCKQAVHSGDGLLTISEKDGINVSEAGKHVTDYWSHLYPNQLDLPCQFSETDVLFSCSNTAQKPKFDLQDDMIWPAYPGGIFNDTKKTFTHVPRAQPADAKKFVESYSEDDKKMAFKVPRTKQPLASSKVSAELGTSECSIRSRKARIPLLRGMAPRPSAVPFFQESNRAGPDISGVPGEMKS